MNSDLRLKIIDLLKYTRTMRRSQRDYFKNRLRGDFLASREAELAVDKLLDEIDRDLAEIAEKKRRDAQMALFNSGKGS